MQSPCFCEQREAKPLTALPAGTPSQMAVEVMLWLLVHTLYETALRKMWLAGSFERFGAQDDATGRTLSEGDLQHSVLQPAPLVIHTAMVPSPGRLQCVSISGVQGFGRKASRLSPEVKRCATLFASHTLAGG